MRGGPIVALALLLAAEAADAQAVRLADAADSAGVAACLQAIPASAFTRVVVHVAATVDDAGQQALLPAADLLAQEVAQRLRAIVASADTAPAGGLPAADALVPWRSVPARVQVTTRRDGGLAWTRGDTGPRHGSDTAATALLARTLAAAYADGERIPWPEALAGDSATFALTLAGPWIRRDGTTSLDDVRQAFPAFTLPLPWTEPVVVTRPPRIAYPSMSLDAGASGLVVLQYVVDERGRARPESLAEQWPTFRPRPRGELGQYYAAFVRAARRGVPTGRFEPARIGGCAVPQLVQQGFEYGIRD